MKEELTFPPKTTPLVRKLNYAVMGPAEEVYDPNTPYRGADHRRIEERPSRSELQDLCRKHGISDATFYKWKFSMSHVQDYRRTSRRMLKKARLLTRPNLAVVSPARPESAKTDSSPWDAPCPKQGPSELSLTKGAGMISTARIERPASF